MLTDDQADFFDSLLTGTVADAEREYLYRAAYDVLCGQDALLRKAVDILDASADPEWKSKIKLVQLEGDGNRSHCFWIVLTDVETYVDADSSHVSEASPEENMCLMTGCSCSSFADLQRAKSGKKVMCEHMMAVRLATCMGLVNERVALNDNKFSDQMKACSAKYFLAEGQQQHQG